MPSSYI